MSIESFSRARAFNLGCDARLAGRPASANPYHGTFEAMVSERMAWQRGWDDVDKHWGQDTHRQVQPLTTVARV